MINEITFLKCLKDFLNAVSIYSYFKNYFKNSSPPRINKQIILFSLALCKVYNIGKRWPLLVSGLSNKIVHVLYLIKLHCDGKFTNTCSI